MKFVSIFILFLNSIFCLDAEKISIVFARRKKCLVKLFFFLHTHQKLRCENKQFYAFLHAFYYWTTFRLSFDYHMRNIVNCLSCRFFAHCKIYCSKFSKREISSRVDNSWKLLWQLYEIISQASSEKIKKKHEKLMICFLINWTASDKVVITFYG